MSLGGEESYGYLPLDFVRDKDALSTALLLCEILAEVGDLSIYLDEIYLRYGLYEEGLESIQLPEVGGQEKIGVVMGRLRERGREGEPRDWILGRRRVVGILDYREQLRNGLRSPNTFRGLPRSDVIQLLLEPEAKLSLRPSGTEPKLKVYASLLHAGPLRGLGDLRRAKEGLQGELRETSRALLAYVGLV